MEPVRPSPAELSPVDLTAAMAVMTRIILAARLLLRGDFIIHGHVHDRGHPLDRAEVSLAGAIRVVAGGYEFLRKWSSEGQEAAAG
jgi:hypothetical protein